MGYTAGDTILDDEYNTFVSSSSDPFGYNHFAGTGSAQYGLGQAEIATVAANDTIRASSWNALFTGIDNIANHTNASVTASAVSAGDTIAIRSALITDLATLATAVAAGSPSATALTTSSALQTVTTGSEGWNSSATQEVSATFANANKMRHFFNAGGKIRITFGTTQASTSPKDQAYIDLGTALGNLDIAAQATTRSGSGESLTTSGLANGFHDLGTSYTSLIKLTSDNSNYTSNNIEVFAKLNAAVGSATVITVKVVATDGAGDDQYTAGNTDGIAADIKDTPKIVTTLFSLDPNTDQGLGTGHAPASTATVSNTTS
jgi:hypothetical protein